MTEAEIVAVLSGATMEDDLRHFARTLAFQRGRARDGWEDGERGLISFVLTDRAAARLIALLSGAARRLERGEG